MPKIKLLIIDDDIDDILFLTEAFGKNKCKPDIISFHSAEDAFLHLKNLCPEKLPALIVTDLNMPKLSGFELLKQLKSHLVLKIIPVVIFSNSSLESNKATCMEMGARAYFIKPYTHEKYLQVVNEILQVISERAGV